MTYEDKMAIYRLLLVIETAGLQEEAWAMKLFRSSLVKCEDLPRIFANLKKSMLRVEKKK